MPGIINLKYPNGSGLELSEGEYEPGRVVLKPKDIRAQKLSAGMVFLSSTRITGSPLSGFSSQPGFVADFLATGAGSVIVNFWSGGDESDEGLITDFYRTLQASGDIAASLHESRIRYLRNNRVNGLYDWAGYQLYFR